MLPFLTILALVLTLSTMVLLITVLGQEKGGDVIIYTNLISEFIPKLGETYQIIFGENPDAGEMNYLQWIGYMIVTVLINIVCLNLLIAILSNTYD